MIIKIEQNMSIGDLPAMGCLDLKKVGLYDKTEKPWSKHAVSTENMLPLVGVPSMDFKLMFIASEEQYMDDTCRFRNHLFLNEVLDRFEVRRTKDGQMLGWFANKNRKEDRIVEFTVYIDHEEIIVDFNVEGNIYDIFDEISK